MSEIDKFRDDILYFHVNLGKHKAISYLPINTIQDILKLNLDDYTNLATVRGLCFEVTKEDKSCIKSGSVHLYQSYELDSILKSHFLYRKYDGTSASRYFIKRIARTWLEENDPLMVVVKEAFGEIATD